MWNAGTIPCDNAWLALSENLVLFEAGADARGLAAPLSPSLPSRADYPAQVSHYPFSILMIFGPLILFAPDFSLLLLLCILGFLESYGLGHQAIEQVCGQLFPLCFLY